MVVFTCNHCGETLHKAKVEKHYQFTCRNYKFVSCVDCLKDFSNEEYVPHIKCVTEDERYAAKGTYNNGIVKKGEVKQENWLDMIKSICDTEKNLKPSLTSLLNTISEYSNVPRKKQKFMNFIRSSSGYRANMKEVEEVWNIIEKYKGKNNANPNKRTNSDSEKKPEMHDENEKKPIQNGENIEDETPKKKKKKSSNEDNQDNSEKKNKKQKLEPFKGTKEIFIQEDGELGNSKIKKNQQVIDSDVEQSTKLSKPVKTITETSTFNFTEKILEILQEKKSIAHKKLQKKILKAYISNTGESNSEEKIIKKFNKKLKRISNIEIEDDRVVLQH